MSGFLDMSSILNVMAQMDVVAALLSFMVLCMGLILRRLNKRLQRAQERLDESERQLNHALQRINRLEDHQMRAHTPQEMPRASMPQEDLVSRLQSAPRSGDAPNRYRHVASLAKQGMDAEQIAEILHISVAEASQLMSLSRLAQLDA
jgi:DNA-binding NarL/FixJ family response regulator